VENICQSFLTDEKERSWVFEAEVMEIIDGGGVEVAKLNPWTRCVIRSNHVSLRRVPVNVWQS
jgi:hypothetical protein